MYKIDKLLSAIFSDISQTSIIVKYADEENNERQQVTQILPGNVFYEALMEKISLEEIEVQTIVENNKLAEQHRLFLEFIEKKNNTAPKKPKKMSSNNIDIMKIFKNNVSSEQLFRLKLLIFESEFVQNSTDRKLKGVIRKAKTPVEALLGAVQIYNLEDNSK